MKSRDIKVKDYFIKFLVIISAFLLIIFLTQDYFFTIGPLKEFDLKFIDSGFLKRGKIDIGDSSKVIILEITQKDLDQIPPPNNKMPLPRSIYAKVIDNLTNAGVKAIGIDVIMAGPDQYSPKNDSLLMRSIRKSGKVVIAGKVDYASEQLKEDKTSYVENLNEDYGNFFLRADSSIGIVQLTPDFDGVYRRYLPYIEFGVSGKLLPSFGFALINKYFNLKNTEIAKRKGNNFVIGGKIIPQFDHNTMLINFYGASRTFLHVPLIDVLDSKDFKIKDEIDFGVDINTWDDPGYGLLYSKRFKDKIVIIGSTMPEDRDQHPSSFAEGKQEGDNMIYGVEFHANAVQDILSNNYLYKMPKAIDLVIIFILTAISFLTTSLARTIKIKIRFLTEVFNILLIVGFLYGIYQLSILFFINYKIVFTVVSPALAVVLGYFSSTAYHFLKERRQNVLIKGMFSQYVSKNVVNELIANPDKLRLGGERKNVSILFSDIAGFTTFSENKTPEELVGFINEFLSEMTEIILHNEGTLDKYLGDAIMAFWGAPIEVKDHAYKACMTALQMQKKLNELTERWLNSDSAKIQIRIGINSGDVIVGNIGGVKRFDYTVMGDNVNLASRLEGANKEYGTGIMIGGSTYDMVMGKIITRELDLISVKGKTKPTRVYELLGLTGEKECEEKLVTLADYVCGLENYRAGKFEPALEYFQNSYKLYNDYPSKVYLERCRSYMENLPGENWDGVFEMKSK